MTLAARLLAVLGESPLPADTPMLVELCGAGRPNARAQVWAPLPAEPTDAAPGSPEKVAVLEARAARGESLWHPSDAGGSVSVLGILRAIREGAA